jgi:hypothetical protein
VQEITLNEGGYISVDISRHIIQNKISRDPLVKGRMVRTCFLYWNSLCFPSIWKKGENLRGVGPGPFLKDISQTIYENPCPIPSSFFCTDLIVCKPHPVLCHNTGSLIITVSGTLTRLEKLVRDILLMSMMVIGSRFLY